MCSSTNWWKCIELKSSPLMSPPLPNNEAIREWKLITFWPIKEQRVITSYRKLLKQSEEATINQENQMDDQSILANAVEPQSVQESNEIGRREVFQGLRACELRCNDMNLANACLSAYFDNVHPVIPLLHRDAFYSLYQIYGEKALYKAAHVIGDGSTKEGRAVSLICSVLALGALTLEENDVARLGNAIDGSQQSLFGLGLGFYGTSSRLTAYTHDSIETMFTYFFMV